MAESRVDDQLPPATLHKFGNVLERYGTAALLIFGLAFVVFLPRHSPHVLAGQLGLPAAAGFIYALLGEMMQYGAAQRLDDRGDEVPAEWERSDGTVEFFDRLAGTTLRSPVVELLGSARRQSYFRFDRYAAMLVAAMLAVQVLAIAAVSVGVAGSFAPVSAPESTGGAALSGGAIVAWIVVESLLIVGGVRLWRRLSERWQARVRTAAMVVLWGLFLYIAGVPLALLVLGGRYGTAAALALSIGGAYYVVYSLFNAGGWIRHNLAAIALAVFAAAIGGLVLSPVAAVVVLVGLVAWDYTAVELSDLMLDLVEFSGSLRIPNYLVIPASRDVDLDAVQAWLADGGDRPDAVAGVIGAGDFIVPSVLVVAVAVEHGAVGLATIGVVVGIVIALGRLRAVLHAREEALPALPWLNAGAVGGYGAALLVLGVIPS